jgi:hypothetical protein
VVEGYHTFIQLHFLCQLLDKAGSCTGFHASVTPPPEHFLWDWPDEIMSWLPDKVGWHILVVFLPFLLCQFSTKQLFLCKLNKVLRQGLCVSVEIKMRVAGDMMMMDNTCLSVMSSLGLPRRSIVALRDWSCLGVREGPGPRHGFLGVLSALQSYGQQLSPKIERKQSDRKQRERKQNGKRVE